MRSPSSRMFLAALTSRPAKRHERSDLYMSSATARTVPKSDLKRQAICLATAFLALFLLLEPSSLLDNLCCLIFKLCSCLASHLGLSNLLPSMVIAK